jgi:hypothetical protein
MTSAIRPHTPAIVSVKGNTADSVAASKGNAVDMRISGISFHYPSDSLPAAEATAGAIDAGPAYSVDISPEGKSLAETRSATQDDSDARALVSSDAARKKQKEWRIQSAVARLQQIERSIRSHEAAHMSAGGAFAGGVSFIYSNGPDGRLYVSGGEVPIQAPEGKTPEETVNNMEIVRRAALAPPDPSGQDMSVAAAATQIENRARAAIRHGRFLRHSDMKGGSKAAVIIDPPQIMPTSMAGLIATLMPQQGMLDYGQQVGAN